MTSPGAWPRADAIQIGWCAERLAKARATAEQMAATAVVIVHEARIVAEWGDPSAKVNVRSVRKSLLSSLYGIGVDEGRIDLRLTLADLGVDEEPPGLSDIERQATIRDLLMARSGVYHPAAYESRNMKNLRPARGSHGPGEFWYYNNWDFNALGTIYSRLTGESVFDSIDRFLAKPIGMEHYDSGDGRFVFEPCSRFPAYPVAMSARDLARFGLLFLRHGQWDGRQIVPSAWVAESTQPWSVAYRGLDYGYMWWVVADRTPLARAIGPGSFAALGYGGQGVYVARERDLVVVQTVIVAPDRQPAETNRFANMLAEIVAAMPK